MRKIINIMVAIVMIFCFAGIAIAEQVNDQVAVTIMTEAPPMEFNVVQEAFVWDIPFDATSIIIDPYPTIDMTAKWTEIGTVKVYVSAYSDDMDPSWEAFVNALGLGMNLNGGDYVAWGWGTGSKQITDLSPVSVSSLLIGNMTSPVDLAVSGIMAVSQTIWNAERIGYGTFHGGLDFLAITE